MDWAWRAGMLILTGVPAIVGGGLVWSVFDKWTPVIVWELVLLLTMGLVIFRGGKNAGTTHH
jgi:hypothetical protein